MNKLVLIADGLESHSDSGTWSTNLEVPNDSYINDLLSALSSFDHELLIYNHPRELIKNAELHTQSTVLSVWSGEKSRNRRVLVPAICESYGIKYAGSDAYTFAISQDKYLSRKFAMEFGIPSPGVVVINSRDEINCINSLNLPLVVKPNFEGGSIGIDSNSFVKTYDEAKTRSLEILEYLEQPAIVEEYIDGEEYSICIMGNSNNISFFQAMKFEIPLGHKIISHEIKKTGMQKARAIPSHHPAIDAIKPNILKMLDSIGKFDYIRIAGRTSNGVFTLTEISPDVNLSSMSTFSRAADCAGYNHGQMISEIINGVT